ncbi:MAG: rod-binding protein [Rickettsiales bacterium]
MIAIKEAAARTGALKVRGSSRSLTTKIDETAKDFEAQFIEQMTASMFETVEPNEELGGGDAEEIYQSMLTNEYGKILARTGGVGVADQVKLLMISQQEVERK